MLPSPVWGYVAQVDIVIGVRRRRFVTVERLDPPPCPALVMGNGDVALRVSVVET